MTSTLDTGTSPTGAPRTGTPDTGTQRTGTPDTGTRRTGTPDAGTSRTVTPPTGTPRAGTPRTGTSRSGTPDSVESDAGTARTTSRTGASRTGASRVDPRRSGPELDRRRAAALERLHAGGHTRPRERKLRRPKPKVNRHRTQRRTIDVAVSNEQLGPTPRIYYVIGVTIAVFVMLGLVMVLSATSANAVAGDGDPYEVFSRQVMWAGLGLLGMLVVLRLPYHRWRALVIPASILAAGAMMLPFVPGVGATINGANSWVLVGGISFQPSEFLKLAAIVLLADYYSRHQHEVHTTRYGIWPLAAVAAVCAGVSFLQGDLGSAIVLGAVVISVGVIAGIPMVHIASLSLAGASAALFAIVSDERRFDRLTAFRDIEGNKEHLAWQSWQGLMSIANGGLTGSGIGGSNSKLGYLPLAHSDFIFAVVADELGFIGAFAVIGGFGLLLALGVQVALAAPDRFGMIVAGGIATWFGVQAIVNVGGVAGVLPVTGLTLPFFSVGGTSLFTSMVAGALLLNVSRRIVTQRADTVAIRRPWRRFFVRTG